MVLILSWRAEEVLFFFMEPFLYASLLLDCGDGAWESPSTKRRDTGAKEGARRS